jgi:hypothetical protein
MRRAAPGRLLAPLRQQAGQRNAGETIDCIAKKAESGLLGWGSSLDESKLAGVE